MLTVDGIASGKPAALIEPVCMVIGRNASCHQCNDGRAEAQ
jgi:hypothetical protein